MLLLKHLPHHLATLFFVLALLLTSAAQLAAGESASSYKEHRADREYLQDKHCAQGGSSGDEPCESKDASIGESGLGSLTCRVRRNKVGIIWNEVEGADRYQVTRHLGSGSELVGEVERNGLVDYDLTYGATYTYTVQALFSDGSKSLESDPCSVAPQPRSKVRNRAPEIISEPVLSVNRGHTYAYDVKAKDRDGDTLTYSLALAPADAIIDPQNGLITWSPDQSAQDKYLMTVVVQDSAGKSASQS